MVATPNRVVAALADTVQLPYSLYRLLPATRGHFSRIAESKPFGCVDLLYRLYKVSVVYSDDAPASRKSQNPARRSSRRPSTTVALSSIV